MNIRALIVDDEALARQRVRQLLQNEPDIEIAGECDCAQDALHVISRERPQLLFLDVQMPEMDGFQLLERIPPQELPAVIFTTAFDRHAVRAFDAHAVDYLLKPFKQTRFVEALSRARSEINDGTDSIVDAVRKLLAAREETLPPKLSRITVKEGDRTLVVKTADIEAFEVAGNYVVAHVGSKSHVFRDSLSNLEKALDPAHFLRVSRSAIISLDRVIELQPLFKSEYVIVLESGRQVTMTRGLRDVEKALRYT